MNTLPAALDFQGTPVQVIDHEGRRWLTAETVGRCLGFAADNARKGILKLFERHADEFTEADTGVVELTTPGGKQKTRIFSNTGCVLLSMFAQTPRAKAFRAWAKQALAGQAAAPPPATVEERLGSVEASLARLAGHMADLVEVSRQQARKLDVTGRYIGLLEINQTGKVRVTRAVEAKVLALAAQGMPKADIARMLRVSRTTVSLLVNGKYTFSPAVDAEPREEADAIIERLIAEERACLPASF